MVGGLSRIPDQRYAEMIGEGFRRLPPGMRHRLGHVQFVCGVDPVFAGLHGYEIGRAHCAYPFHIDGPANRRVTTIVLPWAYDDPSVVVHELGHALHETIGFNHAAKPDTEYAASDEWEAFAEALVAWTHWYGDNAVAQQDKATLALFEHLAE